MCIIEWLYGLDRIGRCRSGGKNGIVAKPILHATFSSESWNVPLCFSVEPVSLDPGDRAIIHHPPFHMHVAARGVRFFSDRILKHGHVSVVEKLGKAWQ